MEKSLRIIERGDLAGVERILEAYEEWEALAIFFVGSNGSKIPGDSVKNSTIALNR